MPATYTLKPVTDGYYTPERGRVAIIVDGVTVGYANKHSERAGRWTGETLTPRRQFLGFTFSSRRKVVEYIVAAAQR